MRDVLTQGHIFLNTSLTEAYCMAIVEAASCGLQVVTTRVGGIPEVLPKSLTILTKPTVDSVYDGLMLAIRRQLLKRQTTLNGHSRSTNNSITDQLPKNILSNGGTTTQNKSTENDRVLCPFECNDTVRQLYNWENVAIRTENVYRHVLSQPDPPFGEKLRLYGAACGSYMVVIASMYLVLRLLDWIFPVDLIDIAPDYPRPKPESSSQFECSTTKLPYAASDTIRTVKRKKRK